MPRLKKPHWGIVLLTQASDSSFLLIKSRVVCLRDQKPLEATLQELSPFVDGGINDNFDSKTSASGATARRTTGNGDRGSSPADCRRRTSGERFLWSACEGVRFSGPLEIFGPRRGIHRLTRERMLLYS